MASEGAARIWDFAVAPSHTAPGVSSMVGYRALDVPDAVHRGMPSSTLTFIVSLDEGVQAAGTAEALPAVRPNPIILGGLHVQASHVRQRRGQAGVQVALHPLASRAVFGVPAAELSVTDFDAVPMLGRNGTRLHERVADTRHWPEAFSLVADYLTVGHHGQRTGVRSEVAYAWHLLERSRGRAPIAGIAQRVGLSQRHLTTLFRREVGRTPKTVAMLMRFEYATARMAEAARGNRRVELAGIAGDAGYADQAHLTRDFIRFAGVPPRVWLGEEFQNIQDGGHAARSQWCHDNFESDRLVDLAGV